MDCAEARAYVIILATTAWEKTMSKAKAEKPVKDLSYRQSPDYVPTKEKLAYGCGAFMDGGGVALMSCVMLKYMEGGLGLLPAVASTIMMVAKIWDAITDPLMGFISDNTRGKYGRRKPYMVVGGILLIVGIFLLFLPIEEWGIISPDNKAGLVAWMVVMYLLWNTFSTITMVPYCSMSSDISPSFKERNNANTVKLVFNAAASGLAYVLPLLFIEALISHNTGGDGYLFMPSMNATEFWLATCIIFGVLFGGGLIICGIFVKERIKATTPKEKFNFKQFVKNYAEPYKNRSYRWHIVMYVAAFTCLDMISALAVYYATDVWAGKTLFGMDMSSLFIIAPLMVSAVIMFPLARYVMDKKSKQFAFRMGLPAYIIAGILLCVMDPSWPPILVPIAAVLMGFGFLRRRADDALDHLPGHRGRGTDGDGRAFHRHLQRYDDPRQKNRGCAWCRVGRMDFDWCRICSSKAGRRSDKRCFACSPFNNGTCDCCLHRHSPLCVFPL